MATKTQTRERVRYLREVLRQADRAIDDDLGLDLEDVCNEIDGTCAQLREYAEDLKGTDPDERY